MALYTTNARSYLKGRIFEEGESVEFDGLPGSNLDPQDAEARRMKAKADEIKKQAAATQKELEDQRLHEQTQAISKRLEDALLAVVEAMPKIEPAKPEPVKEPAVSSSRAERRADRD